ncbi:stage II sporulation protein R [Bacillus luteolus]|uniref:Stage II sporulation protein R n=1 Tax=Litchfieldia luteola TaxID=682179 RepID=A0ABR9QH30_9BACI|nr:stage II sporulation protein R [Cytobacillus luteolus]MBE4907756.1 stage II sporulation protein R [Cytobacillus luteolus]MBP1944105.1 stage II sporulation protein R [Cytobacillus luteolus]
MKKQNAIIIYILLLLIGANVGIYQDQLSAQAAANEPVVIPEEAIRLRILANSDSSKDQELKRKIRDEVNAEITKWVAELTSIDAARQLIKSRLSDIEQIVEQTLIEEGIDQAYTVDFQNNVEFPTKLYGNFIYPAGQYEAILITLGEAQGANWWCVLFPPLCFLDFSNGEAVDPQIADDQEKEEKETATKEKEEVKVKFFLVEFFTSLFS